MMPIYNDKHKDYTMAVDKMTRLKIEAELAMGTKPRELSEKYNVPYVTINSWKNKMESEQLADKDLNVLVKADEATLHTLAEKVKESAPKKVAEKIDGIVEGVDALKKLEPKFVSITFSLLTKAEELLETDELSVKDWKDISMAIGALYTSIYNKSGVNVNVMNQNTIHSEKLSMFKSSMRNS